ncbi:MAG: hypothetical protein P4M01_04605 [Acidobacteriota bacterium]|nr:hypothetical protein [Acidobacteriota bacterium]
MTNFAPLKRPVRSLKDALDWLAQQGCTVTPGAHDRVTLGGCTAEIEAQGKAARLVGFPTCLVGGEPATLLDRGFQKFFQTSKFEVPATADQLTELHKFSELLKEALGTTSLYNEGLGSVSVSYHYDRVKGRK